MTKVSVVIPVYGVENYIERCARSLFEQTLDDIEYLFIDDCTTDSSIHILEQVLKDYPQREQQVIIHKMSKNSGQAKVREWGIRNSHGQFIIQCDSDDWLALDAYELLYNEATTKNLDLVISDFFVVKEGVTKVHYGCDGICEKNHLLTDVLTVRMATSLWNKMIKRDLFMRDSFVFPIRNMGEDFVLVTQAIIEAKSIGYISRPVYYYYQNDRSIVNDPKRLRRNLSDISFNINTICSVVINEYGNQYNEEIVCLKERKRDVFCPFINTKDFYIQWRNTFPEINSMIFKNRYISLKEKLRFFKMLLKRWK